MLVVVCSGWATIGLLVRAVDLPAAAITSARVWIGALGLGVVILATGGRGVRAPAPGGRRLFSHQPGRVVFTGAILAAHWLSFIAALQHAPIGTVVLIVFLGPIGVAFGAPRVLGERSSPRTLAAQLHAARALARRSARGAAVAVEPFPPRRAMGH